MDCLHSIRQGICSEVSQDDFQGAIEGLHKRFWKKSHNDEHATGLGCEGMILVASTHSRSSVHRHLGFLDLN